MFRHVIEKQFVENILFQWYKSFLNLKRGGLLVVISLHRLNIASNLDEDIVRRSFLFLKDNFTTIFPSQLDDYRNCERLAMITIDDCHSDSFEKIYPIAKEVGVPITICIPTDFVFRKKWLWFDRLRYGFSLAQSGIEIDVDGQRLQIGSPWSEGEFVKFLKCQKINVRDQFIEKVVKDLKIDIPEKVIDDYLPVSVENILTMLQSGYAEISSHSVSHPMMHKLPEEEMLEEMVNSKKELEAFCGKEIVSFCYPNGGYDSRTGMMAKEAGYKMAFTTVEGINRLDSMNQFEIKRIHVHKRYEPFVRQVCGVGELVNRIRSNGVNRELIIE